MSVHDFHTVVLHCETDTKHAGDGTCEGVARFTGYSLTIAEKEARKAGWLIETVEYSKLARCPNRSGRRRQ